MKDRNFIAKMKYVKVPETHLAGSVGPTSRDMDWSFGESVLVVRGAKCVWTPARRERERQ